MTESQKPPNALASPVSVATLPSMKSKMLATIMIAPAVRKCPCARAHPAPHVDQDAGERENIRMDPEPNAGGDDEPQRKVARPADGACEGHGSRGSGGGPGDVVLPGWPTVRLKHRAS